MPALLLYLRGGKRCKLFTHTTTDDCIILLWHKSNLPRAFFPLRNLLFKEEAEEAEEMEEEAEDVSGWLNRVGKNNR